MGASCSAGGGGRVGQSAGSSPASPPAGSRPAGALALTHTVGSRTGGGGGGGGAGGASSARTAAGTSPLPAAEGGSDTSPGSAPRALAGRGSGGGGGGSTATRTSTAGAGSVMRTLSIVRLRGSTTPSIASVVPTPVDCANTPALALSGGGPAGATVVAARSSGVAMPSMEQLVASAGSPVGITGEEVGTSSTLTAQTRAGASAEGTSRLGGSSNPASGASFGVMTVRSAHVLTMRGSPTSPLAAPTSGVTARTGTRTTPPDATTAGMPLHIAVPRIRVPQAATAAAGGEATPAAGTTTSYHPGVSSPGGIHVGGVGTTPIATLPTPNLVAARKSTASPTPLAATAQAGGRPAPLRATRYPCSDYDHLPGGLLVFPDVHNDGSPLAAPAPLPHTLVVRTAAVVKADVREHAEGGSVDDSRHGGGGGGDEGLTAWHLTGLAAGERAALNTLMHTRQDTSSGATEATGDGGGTTWYTRLPMASAGGAGGGAAAGRGGGAILVGHTERDITGL